MISNFPTTGQEARCVFQEYTGVAIRDRRALWSALMQVKINVAAAAQVFADRRGCHGMWRADIVRTAGYALALADGG